MAMRPEPSIFDEIDDTADAAADAEGAADLDAGRVVTHERMKAWLLSWGGPDETPAPSKDQ
jgi:predicted transcriptional regulator